MSKMLKNPPDVIWGDEEEQDWTWEAAYGKAEERLADRGLTRFAKPLHEYADLGEVENIEQLPDGALANMGTRYSAWYSYATVELSYARAAYASISEIFEATLGVAMHNISKTQDGRTVKDMLKGMAILGNEAVRGLYERKTELQQEYMLLEGTVKGLEIRVRGIEAEAIRRASARKMENK